MTIIIDFNKYAMRRFLLLVVIMMNIFCNANAAYKIAVIDFVAGVGTSQENVEGISAIFLTYFSPAGFDVVERTQIDNVIKEQNFQMTNLTQSQMVDLGEILNLNFFVAGDVNVVNNEYNLDIRIVSVRDGHIVVKDGDSWDKTLNYRSFVKKLASNVSEQLVKYVREVSEEESPIISSTKSVGDSHSNTGQLSTSKPNVSQTKQFTVNGVSFCMVPVQGGTYMMGSYDSEARSDEKYVHTETIGDFMIGQTEVTQELWIAVMGSNPSRYTNLKNPVEMVSWIDCQNFIRQLNQLTGQNFRLPSEAEWEYAARGGNKSRGFKYSGSNNLAEVGWYDGNSGRQTHPVATLLPNELDIYDMSGNVSEWCDDYYSDDYNQPRNSGFRIIRGGCWKFDAGSCRVAYRGSLFPGWADSNWGVRLAL